MAQTLSHYWPPSVPSVPSVLSEHSEHLEAHRALVGKQVRIPIRLTPEARARRGWNDAVAWLEAREAARREWPWPER
jgi:hypothetical protein